MLIIQWFFSIRYRRNKKSFFFLLDFLLFLYTTLLIYIIKSKKNYGKQNLLPLISFGRQKINCAFHTSISLTHPRGYVIFFNFRNRDLPLQDEFKAIYITFKSLAKPEIIPRTLYFIGKENYWLWVSTDVKLKIRYHNFRSEIQW